MDIKALSSKYLVFSYVVLFFLGFASYPRKVSVEPNRTAKALHVLVLTGGHSYDTLDFRNLFDRMPNVKIQYGLLEKNTTYFDDVSDWPYDVIVFYNFRNKLTDAGKANFIRLCEKGIGLVFLHHSVMGFDDWPEFRNIVGAKYFYPGEAPEEKLGNYRHDVMVNINIVDPKHPITNGLANFQLYDEVYGNYWISEDNELLMTTDHPDSQPQIGWTRQYKQSKVVFIQPGHGKEALLDGRYAELVRRGIFWSEQ